MRAAMAGADPQALHRFEEEVSRLRAAADLLRGVDETSVASTVVLRHRLEPHRQG